MFLASEVNALALQNFKNAVDSRVVIPERGLSLGPALSLGFPRLVSLPSLANIAGCLFLSSTHSRGSAGGGSLCFQCLYGPEESQGEAGP